MTAVAFAIFDFFAKNKYARWALMIFTGYALFRLYVGRERRMERRKVEAEHQARQLEEQAEVLETRRQLSEEREDARQRADEAVRDLPEFSSVDELRHDRPDTHRRLFGSG